MNKINDNIYDPKMLSIRQLSKAIDSLKNRDSFFIKKINREVMPYLRFMNYKDSTKLFSAIPKMKPVSKFNEIVPDSLTANLNEAIGYQFSSIFNNLTPIRDTYKENINAGAYHAIEWHRKFTLSFACIVLFLIGAPLGSIIRKGGLGTPLVLAIIFFVIFFLF
jgi:lipopolysaccharide export system permease protein